MHVFTKSHNSGFNNNSEMPPFSTYKKQVSVGVRSAALLFDLDTELTTNCGYSFICFVQFLLFPQYFQLTITEKIHHLFSQYLLLA